MLSSSIKDSHFSDSHIIMRIPRVIFLQRLYVFKRIFTVPICPSSLIALIIGV